MIEHRSQGVTYFCPEDPQDGPAFKIGAPSAHQHVIVCGGRDYQDRDRVFRELDKLCGNISDEHPLGTISLTIWHGASTDPASKKLRGADRWADEYAVVNWCQFKEFPADFARWGKPAGPMRNEVMARTAPVGTIVLAFPGGSGTADMVRRARFYGHEVREIQ